MLRTTLQRRVSLVAGAVLAVAVVLAVVLAQSALVGGRGDLRGTGWTRWNEVSQHVGDYREVLVEAQSTHHQYTASVDPAQSARLARQRYQLLRDVVVWEGQVQVITERLEDERVDALVAEAAEGVARWREVAEEQAVLKRAGDEQGLRAATAGAPASQRFLATYRVLEDLDDLVTQRRDAAAGRQAEVLRLLRAVQVGIAAVALLMVPVILHLVRRWVLRPLGTLSAQMLRVGGGDLQTPVGLAGPPELAEVARSAETMRRRILDELADAVSAREALAQGQPLVAEVRDQLAAHELPEVPGWSTAAALRPAEGLLAGDWYDVLPLADGRYAVVVADVSGHGARAGIVAIQLKRLLEAALHLAPEPDLALAMAARVFTDEAERFASCVVVVVDPDSGVVRYANAGHPAPLVVRSEPGGGVRLVGQLEATGPLLSWLHLDVPGAWSSGTTSLAPGSVLVVYTDGLIEARPGAGTEELGVEGVLAALSNLPEITPQALVDEALDVARRVSGGRARDDVTLVVLARDGAAAPAQAAGASPAGGRRAAAATAGEGTRPRG